MITVLNRLVDLVEERLSGEIDVASLAGEMGTTEYHVRRMFVSLAGLPLSEYVRRRRMTVAAADVITGEDDLLRVAGRNGYGPTEAFARAFRSVHGIGLGDARREGGPLRTQPRIRFRLTVEGKLHHGHPHRRPTGVPPPRPRHPGPAHPPRVNPHIQAHVESLPPEAHLRLKVLSNTEPSGLLQVSDDVHPDVAEGSTLTYLHGVAVMAGTPVPDDLDAIDVPAGPWAVFRTSGTFPNVLQETWAATATDWFPSNPWRLRPGPSLWPSSSGTRSSRPRRASSGSPSNGRDQSAGNAGTAVRVEGLEAQRGTGARWSTLSVLIQHPGLDDLGDVEPEAGVTGDPLPAPLGQPLRDRTAIDRLQAGVELVLGALTCPRRGIEGSSLVGHGMGVEDRDGHVRPPLEEPAVPSAWPGQPEEPVQVVGREPDRRHPRRAVPVRRGQHA